MSWDKDRFPLTKIKEGDICAEVGVWKGEFSTQILKRKPKYLYLIDPWESQNFDNRVYSIDQQKMNEIYEFVIKKFIKHDNVFIKRCLSTDLIFENNFFDWVYIDGNHSYTNVLEDLNFYFKTIKKGGYLCGDDYGWNDKHSHGGPKRAVDEFVGKNNLKLEVKQDQFVIYKK
jgi:hypothetical protein